MTPAHSAGRCRQSAMVKPETKKTKAMTVQVKICGITTEADYNICRAAGASWIGMVYYPGSLRHLTLNQLARLATCDGGADSPQRVLLTVDMTGGALAPLIAAAKPDMLQLHGRETPVEVAAIKQHFKLPVIKAIPIETADDLGQCAAWHGLADWLLFDAKTSQGQQPGGTGHSFDWTLLAGYRGPTAWMLAGAARMPAPLAGRWRSAGRRRSMYPAALKTNPEKKTRMPFMPLFTPAN